MRVILHAGFHKTGTTTLQKALERNAKTLAPCLRLIPRAALQPAGRAARAYSIASDPLELALFQYELAQALEEGLDITGDDPRPLLMSCEDLAGQMPGRSGVESYGAAPVLMHATVETLRQLWPGLRTELYFSTRAAEAWLASLHAQHLRACRMELDANTFAARYRAAADLEAVVDRIAAAVAPVPVHRAALEQSRTRKLGPLDPLLDLCDLPTALRAALKPHPPANTSAPADCAAELLTLNRSNLDDRALRAAKQTLLTGRG